MASGSPRGRIDQFFGAKKNRVVSPGVKSRRVEDTKISKEASPSAKGSLNAYLVDSQNDSLSVRPPSIEKILNLEVDFSSKCEFKEIQVTGQRPSGKFDSSENGGSALGQNLELRKFAAGFLSLYCSDIPPSSAVEQISQEHKRQGSPSLLVSEDNTPKKRHCITEKDESHSDVTVLKNSDLKQLSIVSQTPVKEGKAVVGDGISKLPLSLRKCNKSNYPSSPAKKFFTPDVLKRISGLRETPKSTRGSSFSSPGDEFWNEAIQVADGLLAQNLSFEVTHGERTLNKKTSINFGEETSNGAFPEFASDVDICNQRAEVKDSVCFPTKKGKDLAEESSPMPIKHFDFSVEDKNQGENTPSNVCVSGTKGFNKNVGEHSACVSANHKGLRTRIDVLSGEKAHVHGKLYERPQSANASGANKPVTNILNQDSDNVSSDSPEQEKEKENLVVGIRDAANTPSSLPLKDDQDLRNWLPPVICNIYRKKGIVKLYPWQVDCLRVDGVLEKRNLVYCASTSAGKSFVAEILMLRGIITTEKMALLVLPYVSICTEKAEHLEVLLDPLGKHVRSYYGNQGGGTIPKDTSVAVCTIEKANSLVNRLLEEDRLSEVGIIVIDELHMVADPHRGYLLELLLTKLRYAAGEGNYQSSSGDSSGTSSSRGDAARALQIVGMSATMPNLQAVADWLHAALYQTEFRPVPLEEYIKVGNSIYSKNLEIFRTISRAADLGGKDPDHVIELCNEVVQQGHSVLVFCSSRKGCESTAKHVAKYLKPFSSIVQDEKTELGDIASAIDSLRRCPAGLDPILEETLPCGVAYHHAGLTVEEREIVETCYRKGLVRVLTATSTLAAGVNLPARRVVFRQPRIGRDFIDGTRYRQMAGRAGRTGIDAKGESVLICRPEELKRIKALLNDSCPPLQSCLSEDKNGMTHAILEVVASGIVQTANDIHRYVRCTLLNSTKPFEDVVKSAQDSLRWLCQRKFLDWNEDTKVYSATPLGLASFGSSLSPEESLIVLEDLSRAREGFVLASDLHLVYLVTPINVEVEPDWELFYERFMQLSALDQSVGNRVGVVEPFLMRMAHGAPLCSRNKPREKIKGLQGQADFRVGLRNNRMVSDEQALRVCKRFYVALILSRLVQEAPVLEVCEAFKVARGMVQGLQDNAGRFASMVSSFCERLGWQDLEGLVAKFQNRVSFGVRAEIAELTTIPHVKGSRARALYKAGLRTPLAIAEASISELAKALFESSSWVAEENTAQRRIQLGVAKKIKNGARKIVLEKAEEARVAAFSAFRSLGVNIPQLSQPMLPLASGNPGQQEVSTTFSEDKNASVFLHTKNNDHALIEPSEEKTIFDDDGKSREVLNFGSDHSKVDISSTMPLIIASESSAATGKHLVLQNAAIGSKPAEHLSLPAPSEPSIKENLMLDGSVCKEVQMLQSSANVCHGNDKSSAEKGPVNVVNTLGFDSFMVLWDSSAEFFFDIHFNKKSGVNCQAAFEVHGIAICWEDSPVYYINIPKALLCSGCNVNTFSCMNESLDQRSSLDPTSWLEMVNLRWNRIGQIMGKGNVRKFTWNLKAQIQVLKNAVLPMHRLSNLSQAKKQLSANLVDGSYYRLSSIFTQGAIDICIISWILWPDEMRSSNPNLDKEVKKRLSAEAVAASTRSGRWKNQMGRAAHNGCCRRVAQSRALCSVLWKLLVSEELLDALLSIEIPLVHVLADMEGWGIGVDMEGCLQARRLLSRKLKSLEKEAYKLAGMTFSLYMPADIANVLFGQLKLPIPEGHNKGKKHVSTDKHCLDLLRHEHPIVSVIKEHRTLAKLLNCTLGSICSLAKLSINTQKYTLHGHWLQTSTATGRLSMEEPNLQCVEHMVNFKICGDDVYHESDSILHKINPRDFFVPTEENWLMLTADYSQIELRLMAHFSRDASLIELLRDPLGDAFTMIASKWTGRPEPTISSQDRDQTKRLVYGILYGMGAKSLAEQLNCSADEAREKIQSFKISFPGVASWLQEAVAFCRQKGYVLTLKGRKRFLSSIKFGDSKERSRAQRQAVNSICQGSAADIIKIAMLNVYAVITDCEKPSLSDSRLEKFRMLKGCCRILLQVHDELVMEVDSSVVKGAGSLLKTCMESAAPLLVPLRVKLQLGKTWGSLQPFEVE